MLRKSFISSIAVSTIVWVSTATPPLLPAQDKPSERSKTSGAQDPNSPSEPAWSGRRASSPLPEQFVNRILQQFDRDGDQKLDSAELTQLLTTMRQRRGSPSTGPGGPPSSPPGSNMRRGNRLRQRPAAETEVPGGEKPKRPDASTP